jgi:non-heme chloroperoxidase
MTPGLVQGPTAAEISTGGNTMSNEHSQERVNRHRRRVLVGTGAVAAAALAVPLMSMATAQASTPPAPAQSRRGHNMGSSTITTRDGVTIFYKDWGTGQPIVFSHGWPLSGDDWDTHMLFFLSKGYRVIAHDRRGHGRSTQTADGNDMDHYAADLAALTEALDLHDAIHIGHSTGGGEVARYVAQHGQQRTAKIVLISAVPPVMVKKDSNPGGLPIEVFDGLRGQLAANRAQFYRDIPSGPFYGYNRAGAKPMDGVIDNWWRQGMIGGAKAQYDCIKAFSETDFTEDLKKIGQPALVLHGDDDQIVPYKDAALLSAKLLKNATLKIYPGFPHGMPTTHADVLDVDILAFIKA